jgi:hypothetical protein
MVGQCTFRQKDSPVFRRRVSMYINPNSSTDKEFWLSYTSGNGFGLGYPTNFKALLNPNGELFSDFVPIRQLPLYIKIDNRSKEDRNNALGFNGLQYLMTSSGKNPDEYYVIPTNPNSINALEFGYNNSVTDTSDSLSKNGKTLGLDEPGIVLYFQESLERENNISDLFDYNI